MKIGIMGCGAITKAIIDFKQSGKLDADIEYLYDLNYENAKELAEKINITAVETLDELIEKSDLILESASQKAVISNVPKILSAGCDVVIMSVGALLDSEFYDELLKLAQENNVKIHLPTGAITGIDTVNAANMGNITSISLTTRKPPVSLSVELDDGEDERILFEGKASEAVKLFPKNINVSSTLSLASGIDVDVTIIADSKIKNNTHEIHLKGTFGELTTITSNVASANNPKTSALAAYSAASLLNKLNKTIQIGS